MKNLIIINENGYVLKGQPFELKEMVLKIMNKNIKFKMILCAAVLNQLSESLSTIAFMELFHQTNAFIDQALEEDANDAIKDLLS